MDKYGSKGQTQTCVINFMKNFLTNKTTKAFTLIEVVIAVGLFSIVMMVALAIILSVVDNNKKVHSVNVVVDNLNFAIDSMVRDIKTGKSYQCSGDMTVNTAVVPDCTNPINSNVITLISTLYDQDKIVQYEFEAEDTGPGGHTGRIVKRSCFITSGSIKTCQDGKVDRSELTSSEINITGVTFIINPGTPSSEQPTVFLLIKGTSAINPTEASDFRIQTLISQRYLNI